MDGKPEAYETIEEMVKRLERDINEEFKNFEVKEIVVDFLIKAAKATADDSNKILRNSRWQQQQQSTTATVRSNDSSISSRQHQKQQ